MILIKRNNCFCFLIVFACNDGSIINNDNSTTNCVLFIFVTCFADSLRVQSATRGNDYLLKIISRLTNNSFSLRDYNIIRTIFARINDRQSPKPRVCL